MIINIQWSCGTWGPTFEHVVFHLKTWLLPQGCCQRSQLFSSHGPLHKAAWGSSWHGSVLPPHQVIPERWQGRSHNVFHEMALKWPMWSLLGSLFVPRRSLRLPMLKGRDNKPCFLKKEVRAVDILLKHLTAFGMWVEKLKSLPAQLSPCSSLPVQGFIPSSLKKGFKTIASLDNF